MDLGLGNNCIRFAAPKSSKSVNPLIKINLWILRLGNDCIRFATPKSSKSVNPLIKINLWILKLGDDYIRFATPKSSKSVNPFIKINLRTPQQPYVTSARICPPIPYNAPLHHYLDLPSKTASISCS